MTWATPMLAGLVAAALGGCSANTASLHTGLSQEEFDGRVRGSFCVGMPLDEAESVAKGLGLRLKCWDIHGDYVCVSELYPSGVFRKSNSKIGRSDYLHKLTLHFGDDAVLDSVTRHATPMPGSNIYCSQLPPRSIPLDDCDQNAEVTP